MPSRPIQFLIIAFWLVTLYWYAQREILPYWDSAAPPAFAIDLADEAVRQSLPVAWTLIRPGHRPCAVRTAVEYHDLEDEFSLHCTIHNLRLISDIPIEQFRSTYRVSRQGRIIETNTRVTIGRAPELVAVQVAVRVDGENAIVSCQVRSPWGNLDPPAERIPATDAGFINSLHPIHKLRNIRSGQRWLQPMSDPLSEAQRIGVISIAQDLSGVNLKQMIPRPKTTRLAAEVTGPEPFEWHGSVHDCYVIEYRGNNRSARTWVRVVDGWILRQEAIVAGDEMILQRD